MAKSKKEFISLLAKRMNTDEVIAKQWIDGYTETLFEFSKPAKVFRLMG